MVFIVYKLDSQFVVDAYSSLTEVSDSIEWQDILNDELTILDEEGSTYAWDNSKKDEYATIYGYTLHKIGSNKELAEKCKLTYGNEGHPDQFFMDIK
jgi:hypothetical protein